MTAIISERTLAARTDALPWADLADQRDRRGFAVTGPLLDERECIELADLFEGGRFCSTIDMARHRFGNGRYRYFDHPLPRRRRGAPDAYPALRRGRLERAAPGPL